MENGLEKMPSPSLRQASPQDAEAIFQMIREFAEFEKEPESVQVTADSIRADLSSENPSSIIVIEEGSEAIGYAHFYFGSSSWRGPRSIMHIDDLYLKPDRRGKGFGKTIVKHLAQICEKQGLKRMVFHVMSWNEDTRRFYESLGAHAVEDETPYAFEADAIAKLTQS